MDSVQSAAFRLSLQKFLEDCGLWDPKQSRQNSLHTNTVNLLHVKYAFNGTDEEESKLVDAVIGISTGTIAPPTGASVNSFTETSFGKPSPEIAAIIDQVSKEEGVDARLITAVMARESRFNPKAASSTGAQGLMQFIGGTFRWLMGNKADINDKLTNTRAGAKYLKILLKATGGNIYLAVASYNQGENGIKRDYGNKIPKRGTPYDAHGRKVPGKGGAGDPVVDYVEDIAKMLGMPPVPKDLILDNG